VAREDFAGLAFRDELALLHPDLVEAWDTPAWAEILERSLLGTVGLFSLVEHGLDRHGEAIVIFAEAVRAGRRGRRQPRETPALVQAPGLAFLPAVERFVGLARLESLRVTRAQALFRGPRQRLLEQLGPRQAQLVDPDRFVDAVVQVAARTGLVDVDDRQQVRVQPGAAARLRADPAERLQEALELLVGDALQAHRTPLAFEQLVGLVGRLGAGRWTPVAQLHRHLRSTLAALRLPRRTMLPGGVTGEGVEDTPEGVFRAFLQPFHLLGLLEVGRDRDGAGITHLRLAPVGDGFLRAGGKLPELGPGVHPVVVNPDFEVLVFPEPEADTSVLVAELETFADVEGGDEVIRLRLSEEAMRRAVAAGRSAADCLGLLRRRARAELPVSLGRNLETWASTVQFVSLSEVVLLRTSGSEAVERILMLQAAGKVQGIEQLGERVLAVPREALHGPRGAAMLDQLREAGVLVTGDLEPGP
jgi:hypothetical protein